MEPTEVLAVEVRCDRQAPGLVRAALSRVDGLQSVLADATLVASELVTDAVLHSGGLGTGGVLSVTVARERDGLLISVHEAGLSGRSAPASGTEDSEAHAWGLRVVEQLASRWGTERQGGYRVWADLPLPSRRSQEA